MSSRGRLTPYWLLLPGAIWLALFFVVPMYFMGSLSLYQGVSFTSGFTSAFEISNYSDALSGNTEQLVRSFVYSSVATLIALLIAYPLAYAIALRAGKYKLLLLFAVVAPFFTTYLIRTIAWKTILADDSPVLDVLQFMQLVPEDGRVLATPAAVIAGLTYNFLPFMILPIYASLERIDTSLIEAGKDLYASATQTFLRVTLPITAPGIVAGVLLTFIPAVGDYINADLLGSSNQAMIGNVVQSQFLDIKNYPVAAALSFILMALILAVVAIYIKFAGSESLMGEEEERA